jgi:hypothetical protein
MREIGRMRPEAQPLGDTIKAPTERRRQPRAEIAMRGRYLLADRRENGCTVIDASASALALSAPERGEIGEAVVVYFDNIGRVEGTIVRHLDDGFVIKLTKRSRAAEALATLVERHHEGRKATTVGPLKD